jgi:hypothetical protein
MEKVKRGVDLLDRETIKRLNGDAARLLLVLLTCDGTETLEDLPMLIEMAGLTHTHNSHGKNRYARAFQQLKDLRFIEIQGRTICVRFSELLWSESTSKLCDTLPVYLRPKPPGMRNYSEEAEQLARTFQGHSRCWFCIRSLAHTLEEHRFALEHIRGIEPTLDGFAVQHYPTAEDLPVDTEVTR